MFDSSLVVQSAASSFNNSAIAAPSFFWSALLMLPLFAMVCKFGGDLISRLKWPRFNNPEHQSFDFALCVEIVIFAWLILMHGNYDVLRDSATTLPFIISGALFVLTASIVRKLRIVNPPIPDYMKIMKSKKLAVFAILVLAAALAGFSGMPTAVGFLMQSAAVFCGAIGCGWKKGIGPIPLTSAIMFAISAMMLMQPEFFRFGQLGNLTALHMIFVLLTGMLAAAVIALRSVNPRGRIHDSAFIKLKWLARIVAGLCIILFILTESVPVYLAFAATAVVSAAMSVWHAKSFSAALPGKIWAALLCCFGIMTSLPLITALGILHWVSLPKYDAVRQSKFLL